MSKQAFRWGVLLTANFLIWGVLSFYESSDAAPQAAKQPFSNAVEQRHDIIRELQQIRALLQEQNTLLRAIGRETKEDKRILAR